MMNRIRTIDISKNTEGFVALITVLIILVVSTVIATSLLLMGTNSLRTSGSVQDAARARTAADSCTEEALLVILNNNNFTGSGSVTVENNPVETCTYTVSGTAPIVSISASGMSNSVIKNMTTTTSQIHPTIIITSSVDAP